LCTAHLHLVRQFLWRYSSSYHMNLKYGRLFRNVSCLKKWMSCIAISLSGVFQQSLLPGACKLWSQFFTFSLKLVLPFFFFGNIMHAYTNDILETGSTGFPRLLVQVDIKKTDRELVKGPEVIWNIQKITYVRTCSLLCCLLVCWWSLVSEIVLLCDFFFLAGMR